MKIVLLLLLLQGGFYHWRPNAEVKVFFIGFSESQKLAAMRGAESWQGVPVRFTLAGDVTEIQTCDGCLTLRRAKPIKGKLAQLGAGYFATGQIKYARIDTEAKGEKEIQSLVAHEIGHTFGLQDCECDSIMHPVSGGLFHKRWKVLPTERDLEQVRSYYAGLYALQR